MAEGDNGFPSASGWKADFKPLLPAGIHALEWDAMRALCVTNARRLELSEGLDRFIAELRQLGVAGRLWLDGSFVTHKPDPGDVDLVLFPDPSCIPKAAAHGERLNELFGAERRASIALYACDAYWANPDSAQWRAYWRGQFGFCHDEVTPKGVIELIL